jgi:epoxyqueuosine reductase QueG
MSVVAALRDALAPVGLNLIAAVSAEQYDRDVPERFRLRKRHPQARSLIVIGNGGGAFWEAFRRYCDQRAGFLEAESDPLDRYTMQVIEREVPPLLAQHGLRGVLVFPFQFATEPVSFMHLGALAGFGARSLLGVLVHPTYGPWIALRAAVVLDVWFDGPLVTPFDPCGTCIEKPCIAACPVGAVSERGWDVPRCTEHRINRVPLPEGGELCTDRCQARWQCAYGRAHRYPADALAYHQRRALDAMRRHHA